MGWATPPARPPLVLAEPGLLAALGPDKVRKHPRPLDPSQRLDTSGRTFLHTGHRRREGLEVLRVPVLGCVLAGEGDYRIENYVLTLGEGSFFVVPPGVPQPDGTQGHWERPETPAAETESLWLVVLPAGCFVSSCWMVGEDHLPGLPRVFLPDDRLSLLVDLLSEELQQSPAAPSDLAYLYLEAFMRRLQRALGAEALPLAPLPEQSLTATGPLVRRVLEYVDSHLHQPLSLARLAATAHLSVAHLQRLFAAEVGVSVMQYVSRRRLDQARQLLSRTELPVAEVARLVGYSYPAHFSRVFRTATGLTPGQYRQSEQMR
jgi:AraC-like DNA-binding protein